MVEKPNKINKSKHLVLYIIGYILLLQQKINESNNTSTRSPPIKFKPLQPLTISKACIGVNPAISGVPGEYK